MSDGTSEVQPRDPPASAGDPVAHLVAALWRRGPSEPSGAAPDAGAEGSPIRAPLAAILADVAAQADALAPRRSAADPPTAVPATAVPVAARLLADTARAIGTLLTAEARPSTSLEPDEAGAPLASPVRRRLTRMEAWLVARAAVDPSAAPAADLCLWALEQLEAEGA